MSSPSPSNALGKVTPASAANDSACGRAVLADHAHDPYLPSGGVGELLHHRELLAAGGAPAAPEVQHGRHARRPAEVEASRRRGRRRTAPAAGRAPCAGRVRAARGRRPACSGGGRRRRRRRGGRTAVGAAAAERAASRNAAPPAAQGASHSVSEAAGDLTSFSARPPGRPARCRTRGTTAPGRTPRRRPSWRGRPGVRGRSRGG